MNSLFQNYIIQDWLDENAFDWRLSGGGMDSNTGKMMIILRDRRMDVWMKELMDKLDSLGYDLMECSWKFNSIAGGCYVYRVLARDQSSDNYLTNQYTVSLYETTLYRDDIFSKVEAIVHQGIIQEVEGNV